MDVQTPSGWGDRSKEPKPFTTERIEDVKLLLEIVNKNCNLFCQDAPPARRDKHAIDCIYFVMPPEVAKRLLQ